MKISRRFRYVLVLVFFLGNLFVWSGVSGAHGDGKLHVSFLDVGQGDAIFIEAPNGTQMLLDGGPDRSVVGELAKVMPWYDRSIDILALSHPHKDHLEGLLDVLGMYEVGEVVDSGTRNETAEFRAWKDELATKRIGEMVLRRGEMIDMGDGVILSVVLPNGDVSSSTPHEGMLVMRLTYRDTSFLLTGDMEEPLESLIASVDGAKLKSDVLKVGHHGSHTSSSLGFLKEVKPSYAVISSGKGNSYGHPHQDVLERYGELGVPVLRTDTLGTIRMESDGQTVTVLK